MLLIFFFFLILAKLLCDILCELIFTYIFWKKHILLIYCLLISLKVSLVLWCWAGRLKASVLPSHMPVWRLVWSSLQLRAWTTVHRALPSNLLLHPRERGTTCTCSKRSYMPPPVPVRTQHKPPNSSYYQPVRKGKGQWLLLSGKGKEKMMETLI